MRYRFYVFDNKVICVSSYAGRTVKGYAKCDPSDTFDFETGKKLAQARCDYKIAVKRVKRAQTKHHDALKACADAHDYLDKMQSYYDESFKDVMKCKEELDALEKSL